MYRRIGAAIHSGGSVGLDAIAQCSKQAWIKRAYLLSATAGALLLLLLLWAGGMMSMQQMERTLRARLHDSCAPPPPPPPSAESSLRIFIYRHAAFFNSAIGRAVPEYYHTHRCRWMVHDLRSAWHREMYGLEGLMTYKLLQMEKKQMEWEIRRALYRTVSAAPGEYRIPLQLPMHSKSAFADLAAAHNSVPAHSQFDWLHVSITTNASEADLFYIPSTPLCYVDSHPRKDLNHWPRTALVEQEYLEPLIRHIRQDYPHWNATGGGHRHLMVMAQDRGLCAWNATLREQIRNATILSNLAWSDWSDLVTPYNQSYLVEPDCFRPGFDIAVPQPIKQRASLYSDHTHNLGLIGGTHEQHGMEPAERVADARLAIHDLPSWLAQTHRLARLNLSCPSPVPMADRPTLAYFRGTVWPQWSYSAGTRQTLLAQALEERNQSANAPAWGLRLAVYEGGVAPDQYRYEQQNSRFGLVLGGWAIWTPRIYHAMVFDAIPLIGVNGIQLPFEGLIDWRAIAHKLHIEHVDQLVDTLEAIPVATLQRQQAAVMLAAPYFSYHGSDLDNVWSMIWRQWMCQRVLRRVGGTSKLNQHLNSATWQDARDAAHADAAASGVRPPDVTDRVWKRRQQLCPILEPVGPAEF